MAKLRTLATAGSTMEEIEGAAAEVGIDLDTVPPDVQEMILKEVRAEAALAKVREGSRQNQAERAASGPRMGHPHGFPSARGRSL